MKSGVTFVLWVVLAFFCLPGQGWAAEAAVIDGKDLCGYGKISRLNTSGLYGGATTSVATEWMPNLKYRSMIYDKMYRMSNLGYVTSFGGAMGGGSPDPALRKREGAARREAFFRRQELLHLARASGVPVQLLAGYSGDYACAFFAENMTVKLCRKPADCCAGFKDCGKEKNSGSSIRVARSESSYEY